MGDMMIIFLLFCFSSIGMTLILVRGTLFRSLREFLANQTEQIRQKRRKKNLPPRTTVVEFFHELLTCVQCTGFWCSLFCGLLLVSSIEISIEGRLLWLVHRLLFLFCCGAAGSFLALIGDLFVEWLFFSKERMLQRITRTQASEQTETELKEPSLEPLPDDLS